MTRRAILAIGLLAAAVLGGCRGAARTDAPSPEGPPRTRVARSLVTPGAGVARLGDHLDWGLPQHGRHDGRLNVRPARAASGFRAVEVRIDEHLRIIDGRPRDRSRYRTYTVEQRAAP